MKAAFFRAHGGPEVMEYGDLPAPQPGAGEVLVQIKAAALNRVDKWVRDGWPGLKLDLPHIPGSDGAGVVAEIGPGGPPGSLLQPGDRVVINTRVGCGACDFCAAGQDNLCSQWHLLGETTRGTDAEFVAVPERQLLRLPDDFPFEQAAAAALVFQTAWHSLVTRGQLHAGETVLVVGAGGGVNTASIQIAKLAGCTVYVVGSDAGKCARAQALGVDVVVDNVGAATMMTSLRCARKGGRVLTVGNTAGAKFELDNRYMFGKHLSLIGSTMSTRADFAAVMRLVFAGKLKPVVDAAFPLSDIRAAHERMERGEVFGKIVLS